MTPPSAPARAGAAGKPPGPGARPWLIGFGIGLTALAGYVDALGFIRLGGLFASFMSGNTTQLGVGIGRAQAHLAGASALVILSFALGATAGGALMAAAPPRWRATITLAVEAVAVSAAYAAAALTGPGPADGVAVAVSIDLASAFLALGMGAQNAVLAGVKGFRAGATFVTGALSAFSQKLGAALVRRGDRLAWVGEGAVWLSFALGAGAGTLAHAGLGLHAFAVPVGVAGASTVLALALALRRRPIAGSHPAG